MYGDSRTYSGGTPLTTSFADTTASKALASCPSSGSLFIISTVQDVLAVYVGSPYSLGIGVAPSSALPGNTFFVPAAPSGGSSGLAIDLCKINKGQTVWVRATSGSQTSGSVFVFVN